MATNENRQLKQEARIKFKTGMRGLPQATWQLTKQISLVTLGILLWLGYATFKVGEWIVTGIEKQYKKRNQQEKK